MTAILSRGRSSSSAEALSSDVGVRMARRVIELAAVAGALTLATYFYFGYVFGAWPSTALLDFVVRIKGELRDDWQTTNQPAPHWVIAHLLALFPDSWLRGAVLVVFVGGLLILWAGFVEMCRALGIGRLAALVAGLVAVPTAFGGIGVSEPVFQTLYPNQTAFAFSVAALAAALHRRPVLTGVLAGLGVMAHPSAGALGVPIAAAALYGMTGWSLRVVGQFLVPVLLLAIPAIVPVLVDQGPPSTLPTRERFDLLAVVRQPHHVLYSAFTSAEYVRTVLWLVLAAASIGLLWRLRPARALAIAVAAALVGIGIGALASAEKGPLILVQAELPRLSPYLVLIGVVAGGAAIVRSGGYWGAALLGAVTVLAHPLANGLQRPWMSVSGAEAALMLLVLAVVLIGTRVSGRFPRWTLALAVVAGALLFAFAATSTNYLALTPHLSLLELRSRRALGLASLLAIVGAAVCVGLARRLDRRGYGLRAVIAFAVVIAVVGADAAALVRADSWGAPLSPDDVAWRQIASDTRAVSRPTDIVLTPPQNSGFRFFSHRPVVVEFGSFRYDAEDIHWAQRIEDVTGDPLIVSPSLGTNVAARNQRMATDYARSVEQDRLPLCRYHVAFVVAQTPVRAPSWLKVVTANAGYTLLRVRPTACG